MLALLAHANQAIANYYLMSWQTSPAAGYTLPVRLCPSHTNDAFLIAQNLCKLAA